MVKLSSPPASIAEHKQGTNLVASNTSQSFEDKLYALKYLISGKGIPFIVVKATTSELIGPKKKHLNYLVNMTHEPNVSIPNMVKHLMLRAKFADWSIAFKSIITIHYLMTYGNEKFIQNLASSTVNNRAIERLCHHVDRSSNLAYRMSVFLRRYSRYISSKIQTYRTLGMDFCRINQFQLSNKSGIDNQILATNGQQRESTNTSYYYYNANNQQHQNSNNNIIINKSGNNRTQEPSYYVCQDDSPNELSNNPTLRLRSMPIDQLLKIIPIIQTQFDSLLAFDASADDLCNGIINAAFTMLYKDFVKLYIIYQVAIIRLIELYFSNNILRRAREMLELYRKFLIRMDKVSDFLPVVELVGMDKSDLPNLSRAPGLPLKMFEKHIDMLGQKYYGTSPNATPLTTPVLSRMSLVELPRIEYGTLGRPRRRSLRTPTTTAAGISQRLGRQTSIDSLSPMVALNYRRRQQEEIQRLDRMLSMDPTTSLPSTTTSSINNNNQDYNTNSAGGNATNLLKRKRNCDYGTTSSDVIEEEHRYDDLVDSLLGIGDDSLATTTTDQQQQQEVKSQESFFTNDLNDQQQQPTTNDLSLDSDISWVKLPKALLEEETNDRDSFEASVRREKEEKEKEKKMEQEGDIMMQTSEVLFERMPSKAAAKMMDNAKANNNNNNNNDRDRITYSLLGDDDGDNDDFYDHFKLKL